MNKQAQQYYRHDGPAAFRFELKRELNGARFIAHSDTSAGISRRARLPFLASLLVRPAILTLMAAAAFPMEVNAATLKAETVASWEDYLHGVKIALEDRCRPGGTFLWMDEDPERLAKVHEGEIVVAPMAARMPIKVEGGLIHHWIGAAFLPNAKVENVLDVIRDYDRYKDFYSPSVIESKALVRGDSTEKFTMQLANHEFFAKMAVDADYRVTNVHLSRGRFYSIASTTRVQQLENYGQPREHMIPEGQGGGYIWKLFSIARLEARDGGVYMEMETVALSRGIPAAFRMVADPIVRRVSRGAMLTAIKQTEDAVLCNTLTAAKPDTCPASRATANAATVRRVE